MTRRTSASRSSGDAGVGPAGPTTAPGGDAHGPTGDPAGDPADDEDAEDDDAEDGGAEGQSGGPDASCSAHASVRRCTASAAASASACPKSAGLSRARQSGATATVNAPSSAAPRMPTQMQPDGSVPTLVRSGATAIARIWAPCIATSTHPRESEPERPQPFSGASSAVHQTQSPAVDNYRRSGQNGGVTRRRISPCVRAKEVELKRIIALLVAVIAEAGLAVVGPGAAAAAFADNGVIGSHN